MNRLKSIIVGVDFTPCSASALKQAIRIAEWNQAKLHVVHILETLVVTDLEVALKEYDLNIRASLTADAQKTWSQFIAAIPEATGVELEVEINHPVAAMMRRVRDHSADLLVLGSHGSSELDRGAGTLATACVRKAMAKVMLVRDDHVGPFRSVVACIDFSDTSRTALQQAVRVAVQEGATLHVLHVFDGPWHQLDYLAPTREVYPDYQMQCRAGLLRRLEEFGESLRDGMGDLKPEYDLFESRSYGNGIMEFAKQVDADLVVLGTRGRTNLRDMLWGSTAERVVRHTPCSILAVKPGGFEHPLGR